MLPLPDVRSCYWEHRGGAAGQGLSDACALGRGASWRGAFLLEQEGTGLEKRQTMNNLNTFQELFIARGVLEGEGTVVGNFSW